MGRNGVRGVSRGGGVGRNGVRGISRGGGVEGMWYEKRGCEEERV